jgi:phage/plasmid-associated DNA primase
MVVLNEAGNLKFDDNRIKEITGNDYVAFRAIQSQTVKIKTQSKLLIPTNGMPTFNADQAMVNRFKLVPFDAVFSKTPNKLEGEYLEDSELVESLKTTRLSELFTWLCQGAKAWYENGLATPDLVKKTTTDYIGAIDPLTRFISEKLELVKTGDQRTTGGDLYKAYKDFLEEIAIELVDKKPMNVTSFGTQITNRLSKLQGLHSSAIKAKISGSVCYKTVIIKRGSPNPSDRPIRNNEDFNEVLLS